MLGERRGDARARVGVHVEREEPVAIGLDDEPRAVEAPAGEDAVAVRQAMSERAFRHAVGARRAAGDGGDANPRLAGGRGRAHHRSVSTGSVRGACASGDAAKSGSPRRRSSTGT